ncbi:hypothetical protein [Acidiphilium acidophilum]|uniref:hypothetical protein n=1 Tax=Acidiphilium acidophilum TaxID=76588 RepID=UPI002E8E7316|nr:hypothetical protein [Acidiphilium acidophilum]
MNDVARHDFGAEQFAVPALECPRFDLPQKAVEIVGVDIVGLPEIGERACEFSLKTGQIERWILDFLPMIFLEYRTLFR